MLVVLDEARKRFGCGCEVAVVGFAFIFDLLVAVVLVEANGETAASVSTGAAVKAEAGWRGSSATEFTRGGCGSEVAVASFAGFRLDSAGPLGCSASGTERMQISAESMIANPRNSPQQ